MQNPEYERTDAELGALLRAGDHTAFDILCTRYKTPIEKVARTFFYAYNPNDDLSAIVNTAYLCFYRLIELWRPEQAPLEAVIYATLVYRLRNIYFPPLHATFEPIEHAEHLIAPIKQSDLDVRQAVQSLDRHIRHAVYLVFWEGKTFKEAAHAMHCHHHTIQSLIQRGLYQLRLHLEPTHAPEIKTIETHPALNPRLSLQLYTFFPRFTEVQTHARA